MAEYIERAEVLKKFEEIKSSVDITFADALYLDGVMELIDSVPSADVVEAVRCKDCKWHDSVDGPTAKIEQLQSELEQVKRERNEAISCLRYSGECYGCLYAIDDEPALCEACNESEENCNESCTWFGDPCGNCNQYEKDNWKWRGAKEDKQNEDD